MSDWQKMKKIDMHVHSKGVSVCAHRTPEEIIDHKIELGYDGAVLTNHCQAHYYPAAEHAAYIERVLEEYERGARYAKAKNFRFFLGLEATIHDPCYGDWLLYGLTPEILRDSPCFYQLNQKELFAFCEEHGVALVQAHPYRTADYCGTQHAGDPAFMHGVECNCTPSDYGNHERVRAFAAENGLFVTCGTDYHFVERKTFSGTYLPEWVDSEQKIAQYLKNTEKTLLFIDGERLEVPVGKRVL